MGSPGSTSEVSEQDALRVFTQSDQRHTPLTTSEVAEELDCSPRNAEGTLAALVEEGLLASRELDGSTRLWWQESRDQGDVSTAPGGFMHEQFGAFINAVDDYAIFLLDPEGTVVTWNHGARRIKGYTESDIVGEHVSTFYTQEDIDEGVPGRNLEAAARAGSVEDEGWRVRKDGSRFWANVTLTAIRDDAGDLQGFVKVTRDMTERHEYERQLQEQAARLERRRDELEQELNEVFERVDDAVYALDDEFQFTYVNDTAQSFFGKSAGDLLGQNIWEVLDVDDSDPIIEKFETALATQDPVGFERFSTSMGIWAMVRVYPSETGLSVYFRDITERKERERELQRIRERMEFALTSTDAIVWDWDVDADEASFYPSEESLYGTAVETWDDFIEVVHPEDREKVRQGIEQALHTGEPKHEEIRIVRDGEVRWIEAPGQPIQGSDDDEPTRVIGVVRDITERKRAEEELRQSEERFRHLMEHAPLSIQIFDAEGRTIAVNPAWERLWDAPREELDDYNILQDEQLEAAGLLPHIEEAFDGEVVTLPVIHYDPADIGKPGRDRWIEGYVYPLLPGEGDGFEVALVHHDITERKERELELERYEIAVETVWDGITILDADERFVLVNDAFCALSGYEPEEVLGEHATIILEESSYEAARELHDEVLEGTRAIATLEYDLLTADGGTVPVEARFGPVEYADGSVGGAGVIRDITERRERERELQRARDLLAKTERIADVGGWEIDVDTMDVFWSDQLFELLEVPAEEEPPLDDALGMYHEADRPRVAGAIETAIESGEPFDIEARIRTARDAVRWLRLQGVPETEGGEVVTLRGAAQDITERKQRELALERYETLIEESADVNAILDPDGTLRYVTPSVEYVLGYDDEELVGENAFEYVHDNDREGTRSLFNDLIDGAENPPKAEFRFRHADDSWVWLEAHGRNLLDDSDIGGLVVYTRDVTDRKRYEERLSEIVEKLEESNERLEQFAYVASHDLQEPLRMVTSYLQLLERRHADALDRDAQEFIEFAIEGADRMREMIQDLLAYSRVDTQAGPIEPTDCEALVERVCRSLQVQIEESDAEVSVTSLPTVPADEHQLELVFQNLISNAIKYRDDEPPRIEIDVESVADEWVFRVADNGIGIDPDHTDRIFEIFQRLHTAEEYPGTGIGLALCQKIIDRHGARIWVESEPGEGSTFYFSLPRAQESG